MREELAAAGLCGARDFSRLEDVCGHLQGEAGRQRLDDVRAKCRDARRAHRERAKALG